jgi:hypothetical protein
MTVTPDKIVEYLVTTKLRRYDYINATDEDPNDGVFAIGGDLFITALINCGGDFNEAASTYNKDMSTLWNNFYTALFAMAESDLATYTATRSYLITAFESDYPTTDDEDFAKQKEIYALIYQAIIMRWLYELYARVESEKHAEDKKEDSRKLIYDVVGKAAISPTLSNELDNNSSAGNNVSAAAAVELGDQSSAILTGFFDFFEDLED